MRQAEGKVHDLSSQGEVVQALGAGGLVNGGERVACLDGLQAEVDALKKLQAETPSSMP